MKTCPNHPDKEAEYVCYNCKKHYCGECLTEVGDYYYCNGPECKEFIKSLEKEKLLPAEKKELLPEIVVCLVCDSDLELKYEERESGIVHCPECESLIYFNENPPLVKIPKRYTMLLSSLNQGDIALIKSIFNDNEIDYYILGEHFLGVRPLLEPIRFFILNNQINQAKELLKNFNLSIFGLSARNDD